MTISIRRLKYFQAIANSNSLSEAARRLEIAQPALSHHIRELEEGFGTKLIIRSNKGVTLSPAGEVFSRHANDILQRVKEAEIAVSSNAELLRGNVTVALAVTMANHLAPILLSIVDEKYPEVNLRVLDVRTRTAVDYIKSDSVDLALVPNASKIPNVDSRDVYKEALCYVTRSKSDLRITEPVELGKVVLEPMILTPHHSDLRRRLEEAASEIGFQLNVRHEQESLEIIRSIVLAGHSPTITQSAIFFPELERPLLDIRKVVEPEIERTHSIVWRSNDVLMPAAKAVETAILEAISILVWNGTLPGQFIE